MPHNRSASVPESSKTSQLFLKKLLERQIECIIDQVFNGDLRESRIREQDHERWFVSVVFFSRLAQRFDGIRRDTGFRVLCLTAVHQTEVIVESLIRQDAATEIAIQTVLDSLDSAHSKRAYRRHLREFITWYGDNGQPLCKATVQRYSAELRESGLSAATINQRLCAIRKLAEEASDNGALDPHIANGIRAVKGVRQEGTRSGNWLAKQQAQQLLKAPDINTLKGLRDRAILALLLGCGLRRTEAAGLTFDRIQQRDGRWVLVDIIGKRNKVRCVPMPNWTKQAIDEYQCQSTVTQGIVFRPINKGGRIAGERMTEQAIYNLVVEYTQALGFAKVAPHDLRRTFAKLAHKGGSGVDQIQLSLGHGSVQTTERYLGIDQDLTDAPCDHLGLRL